ncbi:MAG: polysaccharide pyruvyl transferase family protein [Syntrophobacterales bacterium]|nr:polysaccharide pyruvyl transferase family protein [Syntrophobacterales bacterium]
MFFGFHIRTNPQNLQYFLNPEIIGYLKDHEPIGCRDRHTMNLLRQQGVEAFFSACLTLTFPKREHPPEEGKVFLVDTGEIPLPTEIRKNSVKLTHLVSSLYGDDLKTSMAKKLLEIYKNHASLVITTRIHCALPCLAMGIPVIFFGDPDDPRISLLQDLKVPIYPYKRKPRGPYKMRYFRKLLGYLRLGRVNWHPEVPDLEALKAEMRRTITDLIERKMHSL